MGSFPLMFSIGLYLFALIVAFKAYPIALELHNWNVLKSVAAVTLLSAFAVAGLMLALLLSMALLVPVVTIFGAAQVGIEALVIMVLVLIVLAAGQSLLS